MGYDIRYVRGHWEVYTKSGKFVSSVDTYGEALKDIAEMEEEAQK